MQAAQAGDRKIYHQLLTELNTVIERYLKSIFGPADFVNDILQECLISIHKGRHTYDVNRPFKSWMFAIVKYRTIDHLRYLKRQVGECSDDGNDFMHIVSRESEQKIFDTADLSLLLTKLKKEHREVIVLTKYMGYNANEVSKKLNISVSTVRIRLHRAMKSVKKILASIDSVFA